MLGKDAGTVIFSGRERYAVRFRRKTTAAPITVAKSSTEAGSGVVTGGGAPKFGIVGRLRPVWTEHGIDRRPELAMLVIVQGVGVGKLSAHTGQEQTTNTLTISNQFRSKFQLCIRSLLRIE